MIKVRLVADRTSANNVIYKEDPDGDDPVVGVGPVYVLKSTAKGEAPAGQRYPDTMIVTIEAG